MKRLSIAILSASLLLSACGGSSKTTAGCVQQYWDGTVGLCLTSGWRVVDDETLSERGVPQEVLVAFQSTKAYSGQTPTITVTKETLGRDMSPEDYSSASVRSVTQLPNYKLLDTRSVTIDEHKLDIHVFSAQPLQDEPARRFYQLSSTNKGMGYTVTALTPLSVASSLENEVLTMLKSFSFIAPTGQEASSK